MHNALPSAPSGAGQCQCGPQGIPQCQVSQNLRPFVVLSDLAGTWSSECGLMVISGTEVCDANGEKARLTLRVDGSLEMSFGGEVWRSRYVDRDHIVWDDGVGTWSRAGSAVVGQAPPLTRPAQAAAPASPCMQPPALAKLDGEGPPPFPGMQLPQACFNFNGLNSGVLQPPPSLVNVGALPLQSFGQALIPGSTLSMPTSQQFQPSSTTGASPQLAYLEAKVDSLANTVLLLQGEVRRMTNVRRAGAHRRAAVTQGFPTPLMMNGAPPAGEPYAPLPAHGLEQFSLPSTGVPFGYK